MTSSNAVNNSLTGSTGTGAFVGSIAPTLSELTVTGNASANNFAPATSPKVLVGGSTTLTNTDTQIIVFGGSGGTCILPDATTLVVGWQYYFHNNCSGNVTIEQNGGATLVVMIPGSYLNLTNLTIAIPAGTWAYSWDMPQNAAYGTSGLTVTGQVTATTSLSGGNFNLSGNTISASGPGDFDFLSGGNGQFLVGTNLQVSGLGAAYRALRIAANNRLGALYLDSYRSSGSSAQFTFSASGGTTVNSYTAISTGINLGQINFNGDDGTSFVQSGQISCVTTGTISTGIVPSIITIATANPSGSLVTAVTVDQNQNVTLNNNSATLTTPKLATAPGASQTSSLNLGTAFQNTLGYDVVLTIYLDVASATSANILLGVGPTNTPTQQTIVNGFNSLTDTIVPVTIYLPNNYYALLSASGTISVSTSGQMIMPV